MALYYLKESDGGEVNLIPGVRSRPWSLSPFLTVTFCIIILCAGIVHWLGLTWPLEERLLRTLPPSILPKLPPRSVLRLLELPSSDGSLASLDVAMALRGLGKLHPAEILIAGKVSTSQESAQLLLGVLKTISAEGIDVIQAHEFSPSTEYHSVPLCRYDPPSWIGVPLSLESVPGKLSNKEEGCFFPISTDPLQGVQLFAQTSNGEVIGSVWWEVLRKTVWRDPGGSMNHDLPIWLLAGRLLVVPGHAPIFLTKRGMIPILESGSSPLKSVTLDDFLLGIEQKEQGKISADFETLWNDALVIIGKSSDRSFAGTLHQLEARLSWRHLSWINQLLISMGCIFLLVIGLSAGRIPSLILAVLTTVATSAIVLLSLRHGILIPWLGPAFLSLGLLIRGMFSK